MRLPININYNLLNMIIITFLKNRGFCYTGVDSLVSVRSVLLYYECFNVGEVSSVLAYRALSTLPVFRRRSNGRIQHAAVYTPRVQSHRRKGRYRLSTPYDILFRIVIICC